MNKSVNKTVVIFTELFTFNNSYQMAKRLPMTEVIEARDYCKMIAKIIKVHFANSNTDWL